MTVFQVITCHRTSKNYLHHVLPFSCCKYNLSHLTTVSFCDNDNHGVACHCHDEEDDDITDADDRLAGITVLPNQGPGREGCHLASQQGDLMPLEAEKETEQEGGDLISDDKKAMISQDYQNKITVVPTIR